MPQDAQADGSPAEQSGTQDAASPFSPPQLSLPKGGGAIRGIDEKFTVNPATGTGSATIALPLSPGRSGFGPELFLRYDSGSGNGVFGMGWSLSAPAITRRTDKGLPRYFDGEESDVFVLSGAEDLVPVLRGERGGGGRDEFERGQYVVKRYRPRIEGLFALIERWTSLVTGEVHWRSLSKDNVLTVYGLDANARIADPEDPRRVFSWLISRSYDDKGNAILYDYIGEDDRGIDRGAPNERHRTRTANRYLKRVRYGNRTPLLLDPDKPSFRRCHVEAHDIEAAQWMFEAVFDYGEEHYRAEEPNSEGRVFCQAVSDPCRDWPIRRDPFSSYRPGFELRTYRLCHRVLMFHHFPEELGNGLCLVRSIALHYDEKSTGSVLVRAAQSGHVRIEGCRYLTRSLPALDLSYSRSPLETGDVDSYPVEEVDAESLTHLPGGIDGSQYRWVDLDGEGISGVLTEQDRLWLYQPNLGAGRFGVAEVMARPSTAALNDGRQQFLDLAGDGNLDLVDLSGPAPGFYERTIDAEFAGFRPFHSLPVRDWDDPNLRFVDLTGDGIADVLITEDDALIWHRSLLQEGFGRAVRVSVPLEEGKGPRVVFNDGTQSLYLADMSGDGLADIVRIRNGEVCYWPNRGYGRFSAKVTMDRSPWFDEPDQFEQRRIRLADTDGSGSTDILYLARDGVRIFLNETGNGWSEARRLDRFPAVDDVTSIMVTDFLGRGTACIVWSSPLPGDAGRQLRYVDLMRGQKPHLLVRIDNNLGSETRITYASSTEFYLIDKARGTPWVTRLPFPIHVTARIETYDLVSRNRFVSRYTYHHGFYDGVEREFRGFGRVDQIDTEEITALTASDAFPIGDNFTASSNVPPVLTKTWFHTGVYLCGGRVSRHLAHEYYQEGSKDRGEASLSHEQVQAMLLDDTLLPAHLTPAEAREACRSLKGSLLRQEVYALDGQERSCRPYLTVENNQTIRLLQHRDTNRYAVFFTHPREAVSFHYERELYEFDGHRRADPRVTHTATLATDDYGNVLQLVSIGYGRRFRDPSPLLSDADRANQARILLTLTETRYTNAVREADAYRTPLPAETRSYELLQVQPDAAQSDVTNLLRFDELRTKTQAASDGRHEIPYENLDLVGLAPGQPYRREIERVRNLYRPNDLGITAGDGNALLPIGELESRALLGDIYKLALSPGLVAQVYRRDGTALMPNPAAVLRSIEPDGGGYADLDGDGNWWISAGRVYYHEDPRATPHQELADARRHFYNPRRFVDPFGSAATVDHDPYDLLVVRSIDTLGNSIVAVNDYRVLQPSHLTDPNGNRTATSFDALGMVVGTAVMGKIAEKLGDSLAGFTADLTSTQINDFFDASDPHALARTLLGEATTRTIYDFERFAMSRAAHPADQTRWQPSYVATLMRETHASDPLPPGGLKIQIAFSYSDGFGRTIQKKTQNEPGPVVENGAIVDPSWSGSGWTIFNNKGKPVRQYETFFTATHRFEFDLRAGVSPVLFYDPIERVVATLHPNHSWEKTVFDPWRQASWDVNDTVLLDPREDEDVEQFFKQLPRADYLPSWYDQRAEGQLGKQELDAARKTAVHAATPTLVYSDTLGRTFLSIAQNRFLHDGAVVEENHATRTELDITGRQRAVVDALGRMVVRYDYDMPGNRIHQASMEAGERWTVNNVMAKPVRGWDSREHALRMAYDVLRRLTDSFLRDGGGGPEWLIGRTVYGEGEADAEAHNLRGKIVRQFDQAGIAINDRYDFKGNLLSGRRQLARNYKLTIDWLADPALEPALFATATTYDALDRPVTATTPDQSVYRPIFNAANLLKAVHVNLRGAAATTAFVTEIKYNARKQRILIAYGNGARTEYAYDPLTFHLVSLRTMRTDDDTLLQDLGYTFDPVGNIIYIRDGAQQTVYFRNQVVTSDTAFTYDAVYRLIDASGREHIGLSSQPQTTWDDAGRVRLPQPGDGQAMRRYHEHYQYDSVGNFLRLVHRLPAVQPPFGGNWTRSYAYEEPSLLEPGETSNRLTGTIVGGSDPERATYSYDAHGNTISMPHLALMRWDYRDRLAASARQAANDGATETTYYVYDAAGQRVRKVTERQNGTRKDERTYIGGFEVYRAYDGAGANAVLERETLHVMDDKQRVALVETRTRGNEAGVPEQLSRYQFGNHLGSALLELDATARIISYEEYYPYGSTSYQAGRSAAEVSRKRYRYTGKERDEENGFTYHGARYCVPWLGRWLSCDPLGIQDDLNSYAYAHASPINFFDATGTDSQSSLLDDILGIVQERYQYDALHARDPTNSNTEEIAIVGMFVNIGEQYSINCSNKTTEVEMFDLGVQVFSARYHLSSEINQAIGRGARQHDAQKGPLTMYDDYYVAGRGVGVFVGTKEQHDDFVDARYNNRSLFPVVAGNLIASFGAPEMNSPAAAPGAEGPTAALVAPADPAAPTPDVTVDPGAPDVFTHEIFNVNTKAPKIGTTSRGYDRRNNAYQQLIARALRWWGGPGEKPSSEDLNIGHRNPLVITRPGQRVGVKVQLESQNKSIGASAEKILANTLRALSAKLGLDPHDPENPHFTRPPRTSKKKGQ